MEEPAALRRIATFAKQRLTLAPQILEPSAVGRRKLLLQLFANPLRQCRAEPCRRNRNLQLPSPDNSLVSHFAANVEKP